jgi:prophage tail gpP-like protein
MRIPMGAHAIAALLPTLGLGGCLVYGSQQLAATPTLELCEMQITYRVNLSDDSRRSLERELQRRNADCTVHAADIKARRDEELYDRTYRNQSP